MGDSVIPLNCPITHFDIAIGVDRHVVATITKRNTKIALVDAVVLHIKQRLQGSCLDYTLKWRREFRRLDTFELCDALYDSHDG